MDRVSKALIIGIGSLIIISTIIVFNTWIVSGDEPDEINPLTKSNTYNNEMTFNDDTSLTNCVNKCFWLRVKVVYSQGEQEYEIASEALGDGFWTDGEDGWYYYNEPLGFAQSTRPLIDHISYKGTEVPGGVADGFSIRVEAVDESLLIQKPKSVGEAFEFFRAISPTPETLYL